MTAERQPLLLTQIDFDDSGGARTSRSSPATQPSGIPWYTAAFIIVNGTVGVSLLEFPYAFHQTGGLAISHSVQAVIVMCMAATLMLLAHCSDFNQSSTYTGVLLATCGKQAELAGALCLVLNTFGTCVTFLIVIGDQLDQILLFVYTGGYCQRWYTSRPFILSLLSTAIILPLCFPKRISFLKYSSYLGIVTTMYVLGLMTAKYFTSHAEPGRIKTSPNYSTDVFSIIPTIFFGYQECHIGIIPVYASMRDRSLKSLSKTVALILLMCTLAYTGPVSFGYYTFGDKVHPDILQSYTPPTVDVIIGALMVAIKIHLTYPLICFFGRAELVKLWLYARRLTEQETEASERRRRIAVTLVWYSVSLLLALLVPDIIVAIRLCGGLASAFILIFPGMCLLAVANKQTGASAIRRRTLDCIAACLITSGAFAFGLIVAQAASGKIKVFDSDYAISNCVTPTSGNVTQHSQLRQL